NDTALDEQVSFNHATVHVTYPRPSDDGDPDSKKPTPSNGASWEIRGYETGAFHGRPREFAGELGVPPDESSAQPGWFRPFLVELHGIMQRPGHSDHCY